MTKSSLYSFQTHTGHQSLLQIFLFITVVTVSWTAELIISTDTPQTKWRHSRVNLLFILTALPLQLLMSAMVVSVSVWTNVNNWGLSWCLPFHHNQWVYYIGLFILLDLGEYTYHRFMHRLGFFWKFHMVHHSDQDVDVSTTIREHPGETIVRNSFLMLWVFLLGANVGILILRQTIQSISNILAHTQFRLSPKVNKLVSLVLVTPNVHHVHHHYQLPFTDRNYGDVLTIWDRLFGTYAALEKSETVFGLDTHMDGSEHSHFLDILKMPLKSISPVANEDTARMNLPSMKGIMSK